MKAPQCEKEKNKAVNIKRKKPLPQPREFNQQKKGLIYHQSN